MVLPFALVVVVLVEGEGDPARIWMQTMGTKTTSAWLAVSQGLDDYQRDVKKL